MAGSWTVLICLVPTLRLSCIQLTSVGTTAYPPHLYVTSYKILFKIRQLSMVDRCQSLRLRLALGRSSYGSYQHFDFVACSSSQWVRPHILHWWCSKLPNKKRIIPFGMILFLTGSYLSSQAASSQVLSTYKGLTTVFGMGTGGSP